MSLSNTFETRTLQWLFTTDSVTRPTDWYLALFTVAPGEGGGGTECSGTAYARESFTMTVSGNTATNGAAIEFDPAGSSWGTIVAVGIFTAVTSGDLIAYGNLTASKTIDTGDVLRFAAGELDVTLD